MARRWLVAGCAGGCVAGGWCWWLGGWWLVAGGCWLVAGGPRAWRGRDALPRVRRCTALHCLDPPFVVLYSALSIIAPSVNVLRRTRPKPSTIRGAAPDVVFGQSTADRAGARPLCARADHVRAAFHPERIPRLFLRTFLGPIHASRAPPPDSGRSFSASSHKPPATSHSSVPPPPRLSFVCVPSSTQRKCRVRTAGTSGSPSKP